MSLKFLKRFGCVRKSWGPLFENSYFMNIYRNHFKSRNLYYDRKPLLVGIDKNPLRENFFFAHLLSGDKFENKVELNLPPPLQELGLQSVYIMRSGSINGTLCLSSYFDERKAYEKRVVSWNPTAKEFKVIPPSPLGSIPTQETMIVFHGFGYDNYRDDYKVIRMEFSELTFNVLETLGLSAQDVPWRDINYNPLLEIYSLRSNSWTKINVDMHIYPYSMPTAELSQVYMDGMCHWWLYDEKEYLLSFDLHNEVFFTTPFPSYLHDFISTFRQLEVLNECVALVPYDCFTYYLHVSILGEVGVKESWTKLFVVGPFYDIAYPIGVVKNGHIIFQKLDGELVLFGESAQTMEELGVTVETWCQISIYKESHLPIGRINI